METPDIVVIVTTLISIVVYRIIINLSRIVKFVSPAIAPPPMPDVRNSHEWYRSIMRTLGLLFQRIFYYEQLRNCFAGQSIAMIVLKVIAFVLLLAFFLYTMVLWFLGKIEPIAVAIENFKSGMINTFLYDTIGIFNKIITVIVTVRALWLLVTELGGFGIFKYRVYKVKKIHAIMNSSPSDPKELKKANEAKDKLNTNSMSYLFLKTIGLESKIKDRDLVKEFYDFEKRLQTQQDAPVRNGFKKLMELINSLTGQKDMIEYICYVLIAIALLSTAFESRFLLSIVRSVKSTEAGITSMQLLGMSLFIILIIGLVMLLWGETIFKKINFTDRKLEEYRNLPGKLEFKYLQRYLNDPTQVQTRIQEADLQHALKINLKDVMGIIGIPSVAAFIMTFMLCYAFLWMYWSSREKSGGGHEANMVDLSQLIRSSNLVFYVIAAIAFCMLINGTYKAFIGRNQHKIFYVMLGVYVVMIALGLIIALIIKLKNMKLNDDDEDEEE